MKKYLLLLLVAAVVPAMGQTDDTTVQSISEQSQKVSDHNLDVLKNLDVFNAIYKRLDLMYVDTLDANEVIGTAIDAMLEGLDPYTEYYPENKSDDFKEMLTGKYAGIGSVISYNFKLKRVVINEPYQGMPADEAGLKMGDIILSIDGEDMTDKNNQYVSDHLRGEAGTTLELKILRPATNKKMTFKIKRRAIQMPYLPYYGMQPGGIGYIDLNSFSAENVARDTRRAFLDLKRQGATGLVLDLRNNGGGNVQEALSVVNMFVPKDITLLTMRGKLERANQEYKSTVEPIDTVMPIVVLVDGYTASAAEITAGALQDLDRAVVLGTRTYGKGLVQVPNISLPYNGNLKLTTSKYFIPSGRCIQAINYAKRREEQREGGSYTDHVPDSLTHVFRTAAGREVRDGGGIKPDVVLAPDSIPHIAYYLLASDSASLILNYEVDYIAKHPTVAPPTSFELSDADYEAFCQRVIDSGFTYDRATEKYLSDLKKLAEFEGYYDDAREEFAALERKLKHDIRKDLAYDYNKTYLKRLIAGDLMAAYYYQAGAIEHGLRTDKQYQEAVRLLQSPDEYRKLLSPPQKVER